MKNRYLANLTTTRWTLMQAFPERVLVAIDTAITESERQHGAEIRFVIETSLDLSTLLQGTTARERAIDTFSRMRVWDTAANNGVLIYLLLAEHDIEIVADRGYNDKVSAEQWEAVCRTMEQAFSTGDFERGALEGIRGVTALVRELFPPRDDDTDELPNRPVVL